MPSYRRGQLQPCDVVIVGHDHDRLEFTRLRQGARAVRRLFRACAVMVLDDRIRRNSMGGQVSPHARRLVVSVEPRRAADQDRMKLARLVKLDGPVQPRLQHRARLAPDQFRMSWHHRGIGPLAQVGQAVENDPERG